MEATEILKNIEKTLRNDQIDCAILQANEAIPYDRLLAYCGTDYKNRERIIEVTVQPQELGQALKSIPSDFGYLRMQFQTTLPFDISDFASPEVASLLLFLNKQTEFPGWEMNELQDKIHFRYVWLTVDTIDRQLLLAIFGLIMLLLQLFTEIIEQVATGQKTFNDLLEEIISLSKKISKS